MAFSLEISGNRKLSFRLMMMVYKIQLSNNKLRIMSWKVRASFSDFASPNFDISCHLISLQELFEFLRKVHGSAHDFVIFIIVFNSKLS